MGPDGQVDVELAHAPLLLIGGEQDKICPADLNEKNVKVYADTSSVTDLKIFPGRSHFICNEPGWEEIAAHAADWLSNVEPAFPKQQETFYK